jgi:hypothetical protein
MRCGVDNPRWVGNDRREGAASQTWTSSAMLDSEVEVHSQEMWSGLDNDSLESGSHASR